jgi:predicted metal-dependent phosphotriesterase family hydrolase
MIAESRNLRRGGLQAITKKNCKSAITAHTPLWEIAHEVFNISLHFIVSKQKYRINKHAQTFSLM